jgi:hypothetical protein
LEKYRKSLLPPRGEGGAMRRMGRERFTSKQTFISFTFQNRILKIKGSAGLN